MRHLKIVFTLTIVVVVFSVLVALTESVTTPIISAENARIANLSKAEVLPSLADYSEEVVSSFDQYDVMDSGITDIFEIPGYGYVYQAQFQGYQSIIVYMIGINEDGEVTGYKTLQQGDTPGLGAEIGNPNNWKQFVGMSIENAQSGNFDGLSGASVTTNAWKSSLARVLDFHNNIMLGFTVTDVTSSLSLPTAIKKVEVISKGSTDLEVIYTVEFSSSFSSAPNVYTVTINLANGSIKKLVVVEANDSEGIGAEIGAVEFTAQFKQMAQQDVIDGNYDVQAGSSYPVTMSAFSATLDDVILFHKVEFEGYVAPVETEAQKLVRLKEEVSATGVTFTDVTADYDLTNTDITKVEVANNGTTDVAAVITFSFKGYNQASSIEAIIGINLDTNKINGFRVVSENDTPGLGGEIDSENFMSQFDDLSILAAQYGVFDGLAGATVTTNALVDSFDTLIGFYRVEFMGEEGSTTGPETEAQKLRRLITEIYPDAFSLVNVSADYTLKNGIQNIFEVRDLSNALLGYAFFTDAEGASYSETTSIKFVVGINADKTFAGFRMFDDTETPGKGDGYYLLAYASQFVDVVIDELEYDIDEVAGATITHTAIMDAVEKIARFYVVDMLSQEFARVVPPVYDNATILSAFPGAVTAESIYLTLPANEFISNIYEVKDGSNAILGVVYVGAAAGRNAEIIFAWGVNNAGTTQQIVVISQAETWDEATACGEYCDPEYTGGEVFPNTN